ncbi:hypothetical protein [Vibrio cholerae]|uniref:hypothetical protein n=1 Tax=Vibrio cholerae TaxID=666 RepID=UPI00053C5664|nr:hypothetical protein [Vibrio cholerae]
MKYVIRVPPTITYEVVNLLYEEAKKLGIFDAPLYEKYIYGHPDTILGWAYFGESSVSNTICGFGSGRMSYLHSSHIVIDLRDILDEQV